MLSAGLRCPSRLTEGIIDTGVSPHICLSTSTKFWEILAANWENYTITNKEHASPSPILFWQAAKAVLKGDIISYTTHRHKQIRLQYQSIQQDLTRAFTNFKANPTPPNRSVYVAKKAAFDALLSHMEEKYTFAASYYQTSYVDDTPPRLLLN